MNSKTLPPAEIIAWLATAFALLLLLYLHLLPALIAGLIVFTLVNLLTPLLKNRLLWGDGPRLLAVSIIAVAVLGLITLLGTLAIAMVRESNDRLPALIIRMAEIIEHSREQIPVWIWKYLPSDAEQLRATLVDWLRSHASLFQVASVDFSRSVAHILIGMVIGALLSLEGAISTHSGKPLTRDLAQRGLRLATAFRQVVFAQIWISGINASLTALYLFVILPAFGVNLPFVKIMVILTFVVGLLPIFGNLVSNAVIFVVSLSHSLVVALAAIIYLVVIHKLEYLLNARIVGSQIRAKAWELLVAMLVLESAFGITGLIAAPIYYAYMKSELRDKGLI